MLAATRLFCAEMESNAPPRWLSLLGVCGVGKTHLAKRISAFFHAHASYYVEPKTGATLSRHGGLVKFKDVANDLRSGDYSIMRDLSDDHCVCIDDIGAAQGTPFLTYKLGEIMDARLGKWTVLTANIPLETISEMDARIASRMIRGGSVVLDVDTTDFGARP